MLRQELQSLPTQTIHDSVTGLEITTKALHCPAQPVCHAVPEQLTKKQMVQNS